MAKTFREWNVEQRLYTVVFTMRDDETPRVISLRRATNTEIERYETQGHQ
jgi:uncharacterized DUF497 family protein